MATEYEIASARSKFTLRMPTLLHDEIAGNALAKGVSMNDYTEVMLTHSNKVKAKLKLRNHRIAFIKEQR